MTWEKRGKRKGKKRLPEALRQKVLKRYPQCQLKYPGKCTGASTQVDHVIDAQDGGPDVEFLPDGTPQLVGACEPCHTYKSAVNSQRRSVAKQNEWKRRPERHPGVIYDDDDI